MTVVLSTPAESCGSAPDNVFDDDGVGLLLLPWDDRSGEDTLAHMDS